MSSATATERMAAYPGLAAPQFATPTGVTAGTNWMMVPRCTFKVEKSAGGFKVTCTCEDKVAASMVHNLCRMLAGGMCSWCVLCNGMTVCAFAPTVGVCKFEYTDRGVCVTCTSGDPACGAMLQACCDCLTCTTGAGCTCCFLINNTPVCCGTTETTPTTPRAKAKS